MRNHLYLTWFISNASITNGQAPNAIVRAGRTSVANAGSGVIGPDSDYNGAATTQVGWRSDNTHFAESQNSALTWLGGKWFNQIGASGVRIEHGFVPSLTYSKNGNLRSLTAPPGYAEYRWGNDINGAIAGATTNVFTTDQFYTGIRCFIKDVNGNWHASQRLISGNTALSENRRLLTAMIKPRKAIWDGEFILIHILLNLQRSL